MTAKGLFSKFTVARCQRACTRECAQDGLWPTRSECAALGCNIALVGRYGKTIALFLRWLVWNFPGAQVDRHELYALVSR